MKETPALRIIVLGSGTSAGVPMIGCHCPVCSSSDKRDQRTRCSILVSYNNKSILVDTTPELRLQAVANKVDLIHAQEVVLFWPFFLDVAPEGQPERQR